MVEEEEEERTEKENEDNATGSGDEGEAIEGDGEEEDAGADDGEEEETEKNGGEQEGIAESGQSGIDGDKDVEGIVDIEEQLDLEDNPDNITADEAYIENLGFYYPALIKMYKMMAQSPNSDEIIWPAPGAINLLKEAEPYGDLGNQMGSNATIEGKIPNKTRGLYWLDKPVA